MFKDSDRTQEGKFVDGSFWKGRYHLENIGIEGVFTESPVVVLESQVICTCYKNIIRHDDAFWLSCMEQKKRTVYLSIIIFFMQSSFPTTVTDGVSSQGLMGISFEGEVDSDVKPSSVMSAMVENKVIPADVIAFRGCPETSSQQSVYCIYIYMLNRELIIYLCHVHFIT